MVNKMPTRKILILACTMILVGAFMLLATGVVYAVAPSTTSATYNVGTGALVLTGGNMVADAKTGTNDVDPTKFIISDGFLHTYTLTAKKVELDTGGATATINLPDKDKAALATWMDKAGTADRAGGTYNLAALPGWNGATSSYDMACTITVSGIPTITTATYDVTSTSRKLVLTGTNLVSTGKTTDIDPKYLTITNGFDHYVTLSASTPKVKIDSATQATIVLSARDAAAIETIFDKNGTKDVANKNYAVYAVAGWNGPTSMTDLANETTDTPAYNQLTVSNYAAPTATTSTVTAVTIGAGSVKGQSSKVGSLYLIPKATDLTGATATNLDTLVTGKTALKAKVLTALTDVSITVPKTLNIGGPTATYVLVAADTAGVLSSKSSDITINNIPAPVLTAVAAAGSTAGTTKVTATAGSGDTLAYKVSSTTIATPKVGDASTGTSAYTGGADISGVDKTTNKYLGIYELDGSTNIVKFKMFTLTASLIKADTTAPTLNSGSACLVGFKTQVTDANGAIVALKKGANFTTNAIPTITITNNAALADDGSDSTFAVDGSGNLTITTDCAQVTGTELAAQFTADAGIATVKAIWNVTAAGTGASNITAQTATAVAEDAAGTDVVKMVFSESIATTTNLTNTTLVIKDTTGNTTRTLGTAPNTFMNGANVYVLMGSGSDVVATDHVKTVTVSDGWNTPTITCDDTLD